MQTKLLLAALAANSVSATKAKQAPPTPEEQLRDIYERCKLVIDGLNFQVKRTEGNYVGRVSFGLQDAEDCPKLDITVKTYVQKSDGTMRKETSNRPFADDQIGLLIAGQVVDIELFTGGAYPNYVVEVRATPADLACGLPFDLVQDLIPIDVKCEPTFTNLQASVSCVGGPCNATSQLKHTYNYEIDPASWNDWVCDKVTSTIVATGNTTTGISLGSQDKTNPYVKSFITPTTSNLSFVTGGTFEAIDYHIDFLDEGAIIGFLDADDTESPHMPCSVTATCSGFAVVNKTGFTTSMKVIPNFHYTCAPENISRFNEFSDCATVLASDTCTDKVCSAQYNHSLLWVDLPQNFCGTVRWYDPQENLVGTCSITKPWEGNSPCEFSINQIQIESSRDETDFSQIVTVTQTIQSSISCPQFNRTFDFIIQDDGCPAPTESRVSSTQSWKDVAMGEFVWMQKIPEFFGQVYVTGTMIPADGTAPSQKKNSNKVHITPQPCVITTVTTGEQTHLDGTITSTTSDVVTATNHWCLLPNMEICLVESNNDDAATGNTGCFNSSDQRFSDLFTTQGLIGSTSHGDQNFCFNHKITVSHDSQCHYPAQLPTTSEAEKQLCNVQHCTLSSVEVKFNNISNTEHDILNPTYLIQGAFSTSLQIDGYDSCKPLHATYEVLYLGIDDLLSEKQVVTQGQLTSDQMQEASEQWLGLTFDNINEQEGYYVVCVTLGLVEPSIYEKPVSDCSNYMHYKTKCEHQITDFSMGTSLPDNQFTTYNHQLNFAGFQNKWCGEMIAESSVTDPWNQTYTTDTETTANSPNVSQVFTIQQDDNFINGSYTAAVSWHEIDLVASDKNNKKQTSFEITDARIWCEPSLSLAFNWATDQTTERWDFVAFQSHNFNFNYYVICESPVFAVVFDNQEKTFLLPQPQLSTDEYDHTFQVTMPVTRVYYADLSITTHPLNGAKFNASTKPNIHYDPLCYVYGVSVTKSSIKYGNHNGDDTILVLNLEATVKGNCGDDVLYTLALDDAQFDTTRVGQQEMPHVKSTVPLGPNLASTQLSFDGSIGHHVCIEYEVNAHKAPRQDAGTTKDSDKTCITVADIMRCVVKAEITQMSFGEQSEKLEAQFDLKCAVSDCSAPTGYFTFFNTSGKSSDAYGKVLKSFELEECIKDKHRVTVIADNEPGCYGPSFHLYDTREPADSLATLASGCVQYMPVCHTQILSMTNPTNTLNFDETYVASEFHIQLESHEERFCGYQMVRMEFFDQNQKRVFVHEIDRKQIDQAKSKDGFTMNSQIENTLGTTYSVTMTYTDEFNTLNPATYSLPNFFTGQPNTICSMEVESFVLDQLTQDTGSANTYTASFSILAHATQACFADFEAQLNFIHNDEYVENYVLSDPSSIIRVADDGTRQSINISIKNLTDISGEFYGQIEMSGAGQYHVRDSGSLSMSL